MLTDTALREAFSHFPQGMVLVAAEIDGVRHGLVASTFTVGVSLDPPLVSFAVQHSSRSWPILREQDHLGVTVLGRAQVPFARPLAATDRDRRFDGVDESVDPSGPLTQGSGPAASDVRVDPRGALTLWDAPAWMTVRVHDQFPAGDHDIVLLRVQEIDSLPGAEAIVFHHSRFKELAPADAHV